MRPPSSGTAGTGTAPDLEVLSSIEPLTVVVADDNEDVRQLVSLLLDTEDGFRVVGEARDGLEAVEAAGRVRPDVVLLDVDMPRMGGFAALTEIRRVAPASRVVLLSALPAARLAGAASDAGADGYLEKGVHLERIAADLRRMLST